MTPSNISGMQSVGGGFHVDMDKLEKPATSIQDSATADELQQMLSVQAKVSADNANRYASMAEEQRRIARAAVAALRQLQDPEPMPMFDPSGEESEGMDSSYAQKRGAF